MNIEEEIYDTPEERAVRIELERTKQKIAGLAAPKLWSKLDHFIQHTETLIDIGIPSIGFREDFHAAATPEIISLVTEYRSIEYKLKKLKSVIKWQRYDGNNVTHIEIKG